MKKYYLSQLSNNEKNILLEYSKIQGTIEQKDEVVNYEKYFPEGLDFEDYYYATTAEMNVLK